MELKTFGSYCRYYEESTIDEILEDVYYTDYMYAYKYFLLLPIYEKLLEENKRLKNKIKKLKEVK